MLHYLTTPWFRHVLRVCSLVRSWWLLFWDGWLQGWMICATRRVAPKLPAPGCATIWPGYGATQPIESKDLRDAAAVTNWYFPFHIIFSIFSSLISGLDMKTNSDIPRRVRCNNLATVPLFGGPFFGVSRTKTHSGGFCHVSLTCCLNFIVTSTHCIKLQHLAYHLIASFIHLNLSMLRIGLWNAMLKREFLKSPNSTDPVMIISRHRRAINPFMTCFLCLMCREGWLTPAMYSDNALDCCIELQT